ncbi:MAG: peptidylprolyl isomerase [Gammaproteobacteria bacterium]|nr:peptidylprolyl isomerase [Gammaproteobacteria bacterium]MBQ0839889.1 peptidylprolyl isomerase [Gammaproteobacteria bacterium]
MQPARFAQHFFYQNLVACCLLIFCHSLWAETPTSAAPTEPQPRIIITTTLGDIEIELAPEKAPLTVRNFLQYADRHYYDGTIFHRVIQGFIIETGGFDRKLNAFEPGQSVKNESVGGLLNIKGSVAMARSHDPDSAKAQFFFNLKNNRNFDAKYGNPGYTVFGQVISGMEVVQSIATSKVEKLNHQFVHKPLEDIQIINIRRSPTR